MDKEFLTPKDVSSILSIGKTKTYELINSNGFPKVKIGKLIRVPKVEFEKYMKRNITF